MGVKGLWRLLLPIGRRISIETLHGKILAIDASIWLTQFVKAMRDPETGRVTAAAHLIGFFRRLCRLRFHGIKAVFVFDGATPEIKKREVMERKRRREQFATLTDGSVQRLARKLLTETLQRKQKEAASRLQSAGAFVAGFDPGDQDKCRTDGDQKADSVIASKTEGQESDDLTYLKDDLEEVVEIDATKKEQDVNDWDLPLAVAAAEEAKEMEEESGESDVEYEDFNVLTSKPQITKEVGFSVDYISSLPAVQRKDAVEKAKREQRLQSRTEFMPAAAHPEDFSSVQLKNFLKSCKLNKDIQSMAKAAAAKDDNGLPGEVMASDRTTRVELIREDDEKSARDDHEGPISLLQAKLKAKTRTKRQVADRETTSDDDSSDVMDRGKLSTARARNSAKRRKLVVDDDESDESIQEVAVRATNGHLYIRDTIELMDDSSEEEGGFVASGHQNLDFNPKARQQDATFKFNDDNADPYRDGSAGRTPEVVDINDSDESDLKGGGFLKVGSVLKFERTLCDNKYTQENEYQYLPSQKGEHANSELPRIGEVMESGIHRNTDGQEVKDQMLAEALQQSENVDNISALCSPGAEFPRQVLVAGAPKGDQLSLSRETNVISNKLTAEAGDSSGDDEVDWEDGASASSNGKSVPDDKMQNMPTNKGIDAFVNTDLGGNYRGSIDIEYRENGGMCATGDKDELSVAESYSLPGDDGAGNRTDSNDFAAKNFESPVVDRTSRPGRNGGLPTDDYMSPETSAALLQAQTTAANLTNWAGRAFRRAIEEVRGNDILLVSESAASSKQTDLLDRSSTMATSLEAKSEVERAKIDAAPANSFSGNAEPEASVALAYPETLTAQPFDASFLLEKDEEWAAERNRRERDMETISDEMLEEAKQLLQLFGVPYIEAPTEAEAQCAALEALGLVDGIVTEDSDVFVFGGKTGKSIGRNDVPKNQISFHLHTAVYKNIFNEQHYAEVYTAADAEREMKLGRNAMVALAMLLGSDYTEGVKGVGIVNAMEILDTFDVTHDLRDGLSSFKKWLDGFDPADVLGVKSIEHQKSKESLFNSKHRTARTRWVATQNFPAENVMKAYLDPVVDKSSERFSWGGECRYVRS